MALGIIKITDEEYFELCEFVHSIVGMTIGHNKKYLIETRLSKRLNELNISTYKDYLNLLKYSSSKKSELDHFANAVTTNETFFLRERAHFDHLTSEIITERARAGMNSFKILCAPCSTGEEPYSIVMVATEKGLIPKHNFQIYGTDINTEVLTTAKEGIYKSISFRGVPSEYKNKYFTQDGNSFILSPDVKKYVKIFYSNLMENQNKAVFGGGLDVIFCRNVLIYFDKKGKQAILENLYKVLNPGGILYISNSENIAQVTTQYKMISHGGSLFYVRQEDIDSGLLLSNGKLNPDARYMGGSASSGAIFSGYNQTSPSSSTSSRTAASTGLNRTDRFSSIAGSSNRSVSNDTANSRERTSTTGTTGTTGTTTTTSRFSSIINKDQKK